MASARVEYVQPEPPPRKVILELSEEEAGALLAVVGSLVGDGPVRDGTGAVFDALRPLFVQRFNPFMNGSAPELDYRVRPPKLKP